MGVKIEQKSIRNRNPRRDACFCDRKTPQGAPRRPQDAPETLQDATGRSQDAPKTPQDGPETAPRRPPGSPRGPRTPPRWSGTLPGLPQDRPGTLQDPPRSSPRPILSRFGFDLGPLLPKCPNISNMSGTSPVLLWCPMRWPRKHTPDGTSIHNGGSPEGAAVVRPVGVFHN